MSLAPDIPTVHWLESLPVGLAVFGADSRLVFINPRFFPLLGLDGPPPKIATLDELLDTLRRNDPQGAALLSETCTAGHANSATVRWARGETVINVSVTVLPEGGRIVTLADATPHTEAAMEAAGQARSRLLATMSHELRTPLNAVIGFSEAILRETDNPSSARVAEFARRINESGRNLRGLVNLVLDVASIESGRFELEFAPVDIPRLIRNAVRQLDASAQAAEVTLYTEVADGLPALRGDERRLLQVLNDLLSNAVKFTEAGGRIAVGARVEQDGGLLIYVRDTGIGIASENLERVFEPFTQIDAALSRRSQGAGLGLYVSRALVAGHGGRLTLQSEIGRGTTAEIRLPVAR